MHPQHSPGHHNRGGRNNHERHQRMPRPDLLSWSQENIILRDEQEANLATSTNPMIRQSHGPMSGQSYVPPPQAPPSTYNGSPRSGRYLTEGALAFGGDNTNLWIHQQEIKIKISNMPPGSAAVDVYKALETLGQIVRIEISPGRDTAWVTFQPPPPSAVLWDRPVIILGRTVGLSVQPWTMQTVLSPLNPAREYPVINILHASSIDFGAQLDKTSMMVMHTAIGSVQVTLDLRRKKEIDIKFPQEIDGKILRYRFRLPIAQIERIHKVKSELAGKHDLIIPFEKPPQFFQYGRIDRTGKVSGIYNTFSPNDKNWNDWNVWYRQTDVTDFETQKRLQREALRQHQGTPVIDIGRWTTYRLSFDTSALTGPQFNDFKEALADHGVSISTLAEYTYTRGSPASMWDMLKDEVSMTQKGLNVPFQSAYDDLFTQEINLTFPVRYQLEVCLSNGYIREYSMTRAFLENLASMDSEYAVRILENIADKKTVHYHPDDIFQVPVKAGYEKKIPSYCVLARAVNITPTMIHVSSPAVEISNRIVRKHAADSDRFIRVKFTDEKTEGCIRNQSNDRCDALYNRIQRAMRHGIIVAGRFYVFLAFGNSQFRENGAYFYASTASATADSIRSSMGEFDHLRSAAKMGARLGQCFSTTRYIHGVPKVIMDRGFDVKRNGYTFTDGVGKISPFLAKMAAQELGLPNAFDDPPSLYQFRLAGCKGVLAIDPAMSGPTVYIRQSQFKFEAGWKGLEIIRASAYATACLNRQLIIVLSTLGVPDTAFVKKQQEMVNDLERAMGDEVVALEKLQRNIDCNHTTLVMAAMILDGFMESRDPFVMSLLHLWRAYSMKHLKEKARITIEKGAFVLGCTDETETLKGHFDRFQSRPGVRRVDKLATLPEIFLQISDNAKKGHYKIIEGVCVLARNPSLHAGDLRVVRAVDNAALHHLRNVVVFPQTGDRDIPGMCSGGDLDGDDYLVIWDADFVPRRINEIPMDFTPEKPPESKSQVTTRDLTDFFVTYMKNNTLGQIANAHLAQADGNHEGVMDEKCLELAQLHSRAVDYSKTGVPAIMDFRLRPRKWPHFMDNTHRSKEQIYTSKKILGKLFDEVTLVDFKPQYENEFDNRILDAFELGDEILAKAASAKEMYDSSLKRLMAKHEICTEFEAWSVFALSHNQESRDYTFAEEFGKSLSVLKTQAVTNCREVAGATSATDSALMARFVAAMYTVTAQQTKEALQECRKTKMVGGHAVPLRKMVPQDMPLISFPWLFVNELGKIANGGNGSVAKTQQGVAKKQMKVLGSDIPPESSMGAVETNEGVIQVGELLKWTTILPDCRSNPKNTDHGSNDLPLSAKPGIKGVGGWRKPPRQTAVGRSGGNGVAETVSMAEEDDQVGYKGATEQEEVKFSSTQKGTSALGKLDALG